MVLASGSFQDVGGELIGVVQDRPVQSPLFIARANLLWKAFVVGSEYIARSNATSSDKTLTLFSANFAFRILLCVWICMFI